MKSKRLDIIRRRMIVMITIMACAVMISAPLIVVLKSIEYINMPIFVMMVLALVWLVLFYYSNVIWKGDKDGKED